MVIYIGKKNLNDRHIDNLLYVFLMPLIIDLISVIVRQFGLGNSSAITMLIYVISIVFMLGRVHPFYVKDIIVLFLIYGIFLFNYVWFEGTRAYMFDSEMIVVYLFFFPVCILSIQHINDWDLFWEKMVKFSIVAVGVSTFIMLFLDYASFLVYMGFSYALLPFIACLYSEGRKNKNIFYIVLFAIGSIEILAFGARSVVLFIVIYIYVFELLRSDTSFQMKAIGIGGLSAVTLIVIANFNRIINLISGFSIFKGSYFLKMLTTGRITESKSRKLIYESCIQRIQTMGLDVTGFFGDRQFCKGYAYPHNIVYEILMSWGWIIGGIFLTFLLVLIVKSVLLKEKNLRDISLLMLITGFSRFVISGSYVNEGRFWVLLFVVIALIKTNKENIRKAVYSDEI